MMKAVVKQETLPESPVSKQDVPPSVLLIGKKHTLSYFAPALYRMNKIGELVIKATGSLSIVTAVDVAEIVKRNLDHVATQSITLGTDELRIATGELKRMSCIEIHLIKVSPIVVARPSINFQIPVDEESISPDHEIPVETATVVTEAPVGVMQEGKKPRAKRKSSRTTKKKSSRKKKKPPA